MTSPAKTPGAASSGSPRTSMRPPRRSRDRAVDALRALAIAGVIGGHWLVTALVSGSASGAPALDDASPLASMPALAPVSWIFQTLALFFLVGGYSAARGYRGGYLGWLRQRLARLARPVACSSRSGRRSRPACGSPGCPARHHPHPADARGGPAVVPRRLRGADRADPGGDLAGQAVRSAGRRRSRPPSWPSSTWCGSASMVPAGLGWINLPAGWLVPYLLGVAWAGGALRGRKGPALMLAGGAAATAALIVLAGYPASMVGVNGAAISNLNPPTIAAVTFGLAQCGLALLMRDRLARWMRRPLAWAAVATVNLSAMTLFLWHQTAFIAGHLARPAGRRTCPAC